MPNGEKTSATLPETPPAAPLSKEGYRTVPDHETTGWPPGIPYIVGNEVCERFSFYGMRAILTVHLTALYVAQGFAEGRAEQLSRGTFHFFVAGVYALPMIGAIIADRLAGKYRTILYISLFYCLGHAALSIWENNLSGVYFGLALIAVGSGGIKPCVSANVGDQFGKKNWFRVRTVYQIFYFSVNFGSFFATLLIPRVKDVWGPALAEALPWVAGSLTPKQFGTSLAFGIPGVLMFIATVIFWMGRRKFVHVPPNPGGRLGLLDTLSSTFLFLSVGHLFFTPGLANILTRDWPPESNQRLFSVLLMAGSSVLFLVAGLWLFFLRQRQRQDDGFLAVMLYTLTQFFAGAEEQPRPERVDGQAEPSELARSRFWGPAVARFGETATEGPIAVLKIISVLILISVFWALFDQHSSSWVEQAKRMDLKLWEGMTLLPNEVQALNPLLVMIFIPLVNLIYIACEKVGIRMLPLRRITVGMVLTALSFVAAALVQARIDTTAYPGTLLGGGVSAVGLERVWIGWQFIQYAVITMGEVMVSITALEFAYTQAPRRMKSTLMSFLNLTVSLGNVLVALLAYFSGLALVNFFWVFAGLMAVAAVLFALRAVFYVQKDYPQE